MLDPTILYMNSQSEMKVNSLINKTNADFGTPCVCKALLGIFQSFLLTNILEKCQDVYLSFVFFKSVIEITFWNVGIFEFLLNLYCTFLDA